MRSCRPSRTRGLRGQADSDALAGLRSRRSLGDGSTARPCILVALGLALAALVGGRVAAQPALAAADSQAVIARGLEAQFQVSLIRERKLADDRETSELQAAETRLLSAHKAAAQGDAKAAQAELASARADYAKLAASLSAKDAEPKAEIEAYHQQVADLTRTNDPELTQALAAYAADKEALDLLTEGIALISGGDVAGALAPVQGANALYEKLAAAHPDDRDVMSNLWASRYGMAKITNDPARWRQMEGFLAGLEKSGGLNPQLTAWLAEARSHLAGSASGSQH